MLAQRLCVAITKASRASDLSHPRGQLREFVQSDLVDLFGRQFQRRVPLDEAATRLAYKGEREMAARALDRLGSGG